MFAMRSMIIPARRRPRWRSFASIRISPMSAPLPSTIAVLCYRFYERGRVLLLHRRKPPSRDLYCPVGGQRDQSIGESPATCALREIEEEGGLTLSPKDIRLPGIVSESGYDDAMHWL